jgi:hypothetical protein
MATFNIGDTLEYRRHDGTVGEVVVEKVRDTEAEPLKSGKVPPSRFLLTCSYLLAGADESPYVNIYCNRVLRKLDNPLGWNSI